MSEIDTDIMAYYRKLSQLKWLNNTQILSTRLPFNESGLLNIFYLDSNLERCAQYHCDSHVVKMILESTQILCTVLHQNGIAAPYRPTHQKHPCEVWAGASLDNWVWLQALVVELNKEYQYRFDQQSPHKSFLVSKALSLPDIASLGITERPLAMPEKYKIMGDPIVSYRQFYACGKRHLLNYTKRSRPEWLKNIDCSQF